MPGKIDWSFKVEVVDGPKFSASRSIPVAAYDKVEAVVPKKADGGTATVAVQPGAAGKVKLLLITSSVYDAKLTFKVDSGKDVKLDQPQLLVGDGAVGLLDNTQNTFVFKNELDQAATIQILAGRDT